jgi:hypothetical protein
MATPVCNQCGAGLEPLGGMVADRARTEYLHRESALESAHLDIVCVREFDLAFNHMPEAGAFSG